jgi:YVTN family beta-propeller protein
LLPLHSSSSLPTALAETVYVSNEQDNTISVIDGGTLKLVDTIPVGRRPRGIGLSADRQKLYVAVGDDKPHRRGESQEPIGRGIPAFRRGSGAVRVASRRTPLVRGQRERQPRLRSRYPGAAHRCRSRGRCGAGGNGGKPGWTLRGQHLGDHEHAPRDRCADTRTRRQCSGRHPPASGAGLSRQPADLGFVRIAWDD